MSQHTLRRVVALGTLAGALLSTLAAAPVQAGPSTTTLDGTEASGDRARISVLDGTLLLRGTGRNVRLRLPAGTRVASFADLGDRVIVAGTAARTDTVWTLSPRTGRVWRSERTAQLELAGNGTDRAAGWRAPDGRIRVARSGHASVLTMRAPAVSGAQSVTALEGRDCDDWCAAYVDTSRGVYRTVHDGRRGGDQVHRVSRYAQVAASVGSYRTGYDATKSLSDGFPCGLVDRSTDAARTWSGCQWAGWGIGPDARYSHQRVNHTDGYGSPQVRFLGNATGTPYVTFGSDRIQTVAWENGRYVIAAVELPGAEGRYALYRLGVDGSAERVSAIRTTGSMASPWLLPAS